MKNINKFSDPADFLVIGYMYVDVIFGRNNACTFVNHADDLVVIVGIVYSYNVCYYSSQV